MGLNQDVVIVNEFSTPLPGGRGTRGGTPGDYVTRYMAREGATETLAPIRRLRTDDFILRYMAREDAVERAAPSRGRVTDEMKQAQGQGGVAFGYGSASLSDEQLKAASADVQRLFEAGHTVMKTVLSFDHEYLRRHRIIPADFEVADRGDYRGHLDQMKLRLALMHGLDRMSSGTGGYDDLRYVGVIQVDTAHVHAHLAMVDAGHGTLASDGTQRGKLLDRHKSRLRRGLDAWLDRHHQVAHLSSAVGYERRSVTTFIKRWAHDRMREESLSQFLVACLPQDQSLWRAGTNDRRMRKANQLVTELVNEQLDRPGSPMPAAMERVVDYANHRRTHEDLSPDQWRRLVDQGRNQIVERAVNGVYNLVRSLPPDELTIRTPMLEVMSMDHDQMAAVVHERAQRSPLGDRFDLHQFGFRLRSYASRLSHHSDRAGTYRDLAQQWMRADAAGVAAADSRPLFDFYDFEAGYQTKLVAKYRHFLPMVGDVGSWYAKLEAVADHGQRLTSLMQLRGDATLQRVKNPDEAEQLGRELYRQPGARMFSDGADGRKALDQRIARMRSAHNQQVADLREQLASAGLVLKLDATTGRSQPDRPVTGGVIEAGTAWDFNEVKALDLHHLGFDFFNDVTVGPRALRSFTDHARDRRRLLEGAMQYLDASGQATAIADLPVDDVAAMVSTANQLTRAADRSGRVRLPSRMAGLRVESEQVPRQAATALDAGLRLRLLHEIDEAASTPEYPDVLVYEHQRDRDATD